MKTVTVILQTMIFPVTAYFSSAFGEHKFFMQHSDSPHLNLTA
jgi:hypothetical protein